MEMENYKKIRIVGRGAFGTAYLAKRLSDGKEVILKQIPMEQMSVVDRQAALNEIKVLSMLQHPNVIEYFENFLQDKAMMIVMEYAAGGTLFEFIQAKVRSKTLMDEDEVAFLFAQIILPMYYVHQSQVLHRDLKSENIFLTRSLDHIKIGDFGISKILSSKSKAFTVVGTPCYISPELCEGKPYNTKSDVWALGCILYEMCAGKRAFDAPTLPALIIRIMRGITSPLPGQYSPGVRQLLQAMLEVDPLKRPSVSEIMAHHWLAPHIYRIHTTVGGIPCNSKPQRPLSVTRPDDLPEPFQPKFAARRRSPSPFQAKDPKTEVYLLKEGTNPVHVIPKDPRSDITDLSISSTHVVGLESSGAVLVFKDENQQESNTLYDLVKNPTHLEGMVGINIVQVACGRGFICFLTDRGIILTKGEAESGCLGHGDWRKVKTPKIIEELLGYDVVQVQASEDHVAIVTSDYEAFHWGRLGSEIKNLPVFIESEMEAEKVICGTDATFLLSREGKVHVRGENTNNRLFMDKQNKTVKKSDDFQPILDNLGEIVDVSVSSSHTLVLTSKGELWRSGMDKSRLAVRIDIGGRIGKVIAIGSTHNLDLLVASDGAVYFWSPMDWKIKEKLDKPDSKSKGKKPIESAKVVSSAKKSFILTVFE